MKIIELKVYEFSELNAAAKQKAINKYYEDETYDTLSGDLTESCKALLEEKGAQYGDIKLQYSLSWSQGDGLCFTGKIEKNGITLNLKHNARYYYANSVNMSFYDIAGEELDEDDATITGIAEIKEIYFEVCKKLEKEGYNILEYRMNETEFADLCSANEYFFLEDGTMNNH